MKQFQKIERQRLFELVASELEESIISGTLAVGAGLPSEQRLADQFGVSRNVVREALKLLQERGLVEIINGAGAFVAQPNVGATSNALGRYLRFTGVHTSIDALYEARRILEGSNARLAAKRATAQDLEALASFLAQMRDHHGLIERWSEADLGFHLAIATATHNPFLSVLLEPLVDQLRGVMAEGYLVPGAVERGITAHSLIYECIKNRDEDGAYKAITEHLLDSESTQHALEVGSKDVG